MQSDDLLRCFYAAGMRHRHISHHDAWHELLDRFHKFTTSL